MRRKDKHHLRMKNYLPMVLALACAVLVVSMVVMKRDDNAQHESDAGAFADVSNRLESARMQVAGCEGTLVTLSNTLNESQLASLTFSNQLMDAQSAIARDAEQITSLTRQLAAVESEKQTLDQSIVDLNSQMTNQVAALMSQLASTQTNLNQLTKGCVLLEDRFRRDVAERVVAERKFNNLSELQAQMKYLEKNPAKVITAEGILAGLDIVVKSNAFYVYSPD
jgi:chromosome segregation ATPase